MNDDCWKKCIVPLRFRLIAKFANEIRQNTALKSIALCDKQINGYSRLKEDCKWMMSYFFGLP